MPKSTKKAAVADSWEDEDLSDSAPGDPSPQFSGPTPSTQQPSSSAAFSDSNSTHDRDTRPGALPSPSSSDDPSPAKRPEKTDAVARRMIAAGLGLRAPKQTEEQKAYQKSIRDQERRRREKEKEEELWQQELTEKAKAAVWDD